MSIIECSGNIFDTKAQVKTITVNCVGVMGAGIALEAKKRSPFLFKVYRHLCDNYQMKPGKPSLVRIEKELFLLFPTKNHWKWPSEIEWIEQGLQWIIENHDGKELRGIKSIALPPLGCGHGGLNWDYVKEMIYQYLADHELEIHLYNPE